MGKFADVQDGRVDLVADDIDIGGSVGWSLFRVLMQDDRAFVARLQKGNTLKMEMFDNLPAAVARCVEWMRL